MSSGELTPGRARSLPDANRDIGPESRKDTIKPSGNIIVNAALHSHSEPVRVRKLTLDRDSLRRRGFLPDASQERRFADYYRRIKRPIIAQSMVQAPAGATDLRLVMMTSALPGDGKTFTSINLALSIAREQDVSVVLVDADVAKLHLSRILGVERTPGLLDAVVHPALDVESAILSTNISGLSVLAAGTQRKNATELLASVRMTHVVDRLIAANPRRIAVFDSPPLLSSSESRAMLQMFGQVVLVVRSGVTPQQAVLDAISCVPENKPVGLILNGRVASLTEKYYGYGAYYDNFDQTSDAR